MECTVAKRDLIRYTKYKDYYAFVLIHVMSFEKNTVELRYMRGLISDCYYIFWVTVYFKREKKIYKICDEICMYWLMPLLF